MLKGKHPALRNINWQAKLVVESEGFVFKFNKIKGGKAAACLLLILI